MKESKPTIALLSPGDMGHVVGQVLRTSGLRVITDLSQRSSRTKALAETVGIEDVGSLDAVVTEADLIMTILVPAQALKLAEQVAESVQKTGASVTYVDCNAVSPGTAVQIGETITNAGAEFVDASIIGPPPRNAGATRFYASGPAVDTFAILNDYGLSVISLGEEIGRASAIKMCYAALTKGLSALAAELLTTAECLGVRDALTTEFQQSQSALLERFERGMPNIPPKSRRWVGEMEEIAKTFDEVGCSPHFHQGAAEVYRRMGSTTMADRNPEDSTPPPTLTEMIQTLADSLEG